jgi:conjugative relaxase-like TrwC/TraI family protein
VAYVTPLYGGSNEQVDYRLGLVQHGCHADAQFSYHADARERPLRWIGEGLEAFGVDGLRAGAELTSEQFDMARRLIRGQHPATGEQLVTPKMAVPAAAKVSLGPVVAAVRELAAARGMAPGSLFEGPAAVAWQRAERGVTRRGGRAVAPVDDAVALAGAAGLEPGAVWGQGVVDTAFVALREQVAVRDEDGEVVLRRDGTPKTQVVARRERVGIAGYDIGITLPKSMSVLLAFAPDDLVDRVEEIYTQATGRTFSWTEARTSYVKRGKHGEGRVARQERSSGLSGWVMIHRAARPVGDAAIGDPHWHVHITIGNLAQAPDGKWLTIAAGGRELMRHAAAIDKMTQAQVRAELHHQLGIEFARSARTGLWEIAHIPEATLELFSKRHRQVNEVLAQLGYSNATASARDARVLTRTSRTAKSETVAESDTTLREYWRAQALAAGQDPADWMPQVLAAYQAGHTSVGEQANAVMLAQYGITLDDVVARLVDPETGLTAHTRRFSHLDAITATADALPYGATTEQVEQLADLVLSHPVFVALPERNSLAGDSVGERAQLAGSHQMTGGQLYTTADVPDAERAILDAVRASRPEQNLAVVNADVLAMAVSVTEAAQGFALSDEQRQVLTAVVRTGRAVEAIEGPAGTGKTTLMRAARLAWQGQGYVVAGAATAAVAVQELAAHSGIESRTVAQWLHRIHAGGGLAGVDVLVLDEANLTSDRDRAALYAEAARTGTKLVEVGDPKQLRGVGCGSLFGYLHTSLDGPALTDNRRQRDEDERAALAAYRAGRYAEALQGWASAGGVVATETSDSGVAAIVTTWMRLSAGAPDPHTHAAGLLMLAATNEQVARINDAMQAVRVAEDQLGDGREFALPAGRQVRFHLGDQVLIRRNDRHNQAVTGDPVLNGYRGVVTGVDEQGVSVEWRQPGDHPGQDPHTAICSPAYIAAGGLELGYCLTTHKAEGLTVGAGWDRPDGTRNDGSVLVWTPGMDNPGLYVAASRDRGNTILFGALDELEGDRERLLYGTPRDQTELTERVIAALAQRAEATETSVNDRPVLADLGQVPEVPTAAEPAAAVLTDEIRQRHRDLLRLDRRARRAGDPDRQAAVSAQIEAFHAEIGPERVALLRVEHEARLEAGQLARVHRELERIGRNLERIELTRQWKARPHSRLSDPRLQQSITAAGQEQNQNLRAAERARQQIAQLAPEVDAGHGPGVTQLHQKLADLRRLAELHSIGADLERRWSAALARRDMMAAQARGKEWEAHRVPRYRSGRRERLLAEAAERHAEAARAQHTVDQLAPQFDQLSRRTGSRQLGWSYAQHAKENLDRAERAYPRDRDNAQYTDQNQLDQLRSREAASTAAAAQSATRHDELVAEQELRAAMPTDQRAHEQRLRTEWAAAQVAARARRQRQEQHGVVDSYGMHDSHHLGHGHDQGHGLGL